MASAEDITGKIVVCTESIEGFKEEFNSLLDSLMKGPTSNLQVFFHLLSAILTSDEESPINKFYALYLILKVSESSPSDEFIVELRSQEKLMYEIFKAAQYDSNSTIPLEEKGKTLFSKTPSTSEANIGVNYVRLCIETLMFWGDAFGSSNLSDPYHIFWLNRETLAHKATLPHNYCFVGKDYYGQEEIATWNFAKQELPSLPFRNRGQYQEGKGFVQNLNEGDAQIQVIVSPHLNNLSPEKGSMVKYSPDKKENQNSNIISPLELSSAQVKKKGIVEDTPNFQDHLRETPQGFSNYESKCSPVKENPLDKFRRKTDIVSDQDSGRKKVSFHIAENEALVNTGPKSKSQFSPDKNIEVEEPEPPKREKVEVNRSLAKKTTLGEKMKELGMFQEDKKSPINTKDRSPVGSNKKDVPSIKELDANANTNIGSTQDIRNYFVEREKAEITAKRGSIKANPIPETEFRGQAIISGSPGTGHVVNSAVPKDMKEASPIRSSPTKSIPLSDAFNFEQSPLRLFENENINNENAVLRSQIQQHQKQLLEQSLHDEQMSREQNMLNEEIEKYKDASQLQANRHDSLIRENDFLKMKLLEFEQKMKEMNNKINILYNENKRLTGSVNQFDNAFENPMVRSMSPKSIRAGTPTNMRTTSPTNMRASQEIFRQDVRGSYQGQSPSNLMASQQRSSEKRGGHNLRSTPPPADQAKIQGDFRSSIENLGPATHAGKKKIFELVSYEKPRMVLTAKDFAS